MRWIGVDIHKHYARVVELLQDGGQHSYRFDVPAGLPDFCSRLGPDCHVVVEASTNSFRFSEVISPFVSKVTVCDAAQTRGVVPQAAVTDKGACQALARLLRNGFIREVWVPPAEIRALRAQVEHFVDLTATRVATINRIKSLFQQELIELRVGKLGPQAHRFLDQQFVSQPALRAYLTSLLRQLNHLNEELTQVERAFSGWARDSKEARLLLTIPGVGVILAAVIIAQIGDVSRFVTPQKLCAYAGLVPRIYESGKVKRSGGITRAGRSQLRWALNIAVWRCSGRSQTLDAFKQALCLRRPRRVVQVAACRKLLMMIWGILKNREPFREQDRDLTARKVLRMEQMPQPSSTTDPVPKIVDRRQRGHKRPMIEKASTVW